MKPIPQIIIRLRELLQGFNSNNPGTIFSLAHRPPMLSGPYQDFMGNITFFLNTEVGFNLVYLFGFSRIHLDIDPDLEDQLSIFRHTLNINERVGNTGDHPWHIKVSHLGFRNNNGRIGVEPLSMDEVYTAVIESITAAVDYIADTIDPDLPPWE